LVVAAFPGLGGTALFAAAVPPPFRKPFRLWWVVFSWVAPLASAPPYCVLGRGLEWLRNGSERLFFGEPFLPGRVVRVAFRV
jgi:hypothetical protein